MFLRIKILHISCPVACNLLSGRIIMILTPEQPGASSCLQMDYCKRFTPSFLMCFFLSFVLTAHKITTGGLHCLSCQHGQLRQLAVPVVHQFQFCKTARTTYHLLVIFSGLLERSFITLRRHLRTIIIPDPTQNKRTSFWLIRPEHTTASIEFVQIFSNTLYEMISLVADPASK